MAWGPRAASPQQAASAAEAVPQRYWRRKGAFPAAMLAGVLESFLPSGHEVDFVQRLEVFQHESGQAVGLPLTSGPGPRAAPGLEHVPSHCCLQRVLT